MMKSMRCCMERRATQPRQMMLTVTRPESRPLFCSSLSGTVSVCKWRVGVLYSALQAAVWGE